MKRSIKILILIVLLMVLIFLIWTKLAVLCYNRGIKFYDQGLYEDAIRYFKSSLKINPQQAIVHYALADTYLFKNLETEAIQEYKKSIEIKPNYVRSYLALAQIYTNHNLYKEAIDLLTEAQKIMPDDPDVKRLLHEVNFEFAVDYLYKGVNAFLNKNKEKAYDLLNKAILLSPDFTYTHYTLGYFYYADRNYDRAEKNINEALRIDARFWPAHKLLGDIYFSKGKHERAINQYRVALSLNYNDASCHNDLGLALAEMERYSEAILSLREALRLDADNVNIHYNLGCLYRDQRMFSEAISEFNQVLNFQADYSNVFNELGDIYTIQGKQLMAFEEYKKEINYCQRKLEANPDDAITLNNLARAYHGIKEYDLAKKATKDALALDPNYRDAYLTLATIQENLKEYNAALASLDKAKSISKSISFIERGIAGIKKTLSQSMPLDRIYLKNGRLLKGKIKEETGGKVVLETYAGSSEGTITLYRDNIEQIIRSGDIEAE